MSGRRRTSDTPVMPSDERVSASSRGLAQLARAGFALVRNPITRIGYEVHHVDDQPGYLYRILNERKDDRDRLFVETLTSAAYSTGLVIGVRTGPDIDGRAFLGEADQVAVNERPDARIFSGNAVPNVSFLYDPMHVFECVLAIADAESPLLLEHGRAIRDAINHVATLAADVAEAPIISLQSPVQLPQPDRPGDWPRSSAVAVRFAIAVRRPNAARRLELLDAAATFCQERGFGLWVKDMRPAYRAGNWFLICPLQPETVEREYGLLGPAPVWSLPVTLVGPARVGAMRAVMTYLTQHPSIRVFACSMSIVEDVAFIHLQLGSSVLAPDGMDELNDQVDGLTGVERGSPAVRETALTRLLPELVRLLSADPRTVAAFEELPAHLRRRISDFQLLAGPARRIRPSSGEARRALWFSWEVEGHEDELRVPFVALYDAMRPLTQRWSAGDPNQGLPNMEYLICRRVRHATLRGKGKLSLPESARTLIGGDPTELSRLCERIEALWKAELRKVNQSERPARELTVAWRENWLGHWNQPLA